MKYEDLTMLIIINIVKPRGDTSVKEDQHSKNLGADFSITVE